jgi:predicted amidohydrolase YtcJ
MLRPSPISGLATPPAPPRRSGGGRRSWEDDPEHRLSGIVHPDDLPRFGSLGVVANAQALWACADAAMVDLTIPFLGEPRASWQYPFGALLEAGATLAMGSDWSVSTADPLAQIEVAVRRRVPGEPDSNPFSPSSDRRRRAAAFTAGSAFVSHRDDERDRWGRRRDL